MDKQIMSELMELLGLPDYVKLELPKIFERLKIDEFIEEIPETIAILIKSTEEGATKFEIKCTGPDALEESIKNLMSNVIHRFHLNLCEKASEIFVECMDPKIPDLIRSPIQKLLHAYYMKRSINLLIEYSEIDEERFKITGNDTKH